MPDAQPSVRCPVTPSFVMSLAALLPAAARRVLVATVVTWLLGPGAAVAQSAGAYTSWYLAEGATQSIFTEDILVANPSAGTARIAVTFLPDGGTPKGPYYFTLAPTSRTSLRLGDGPLDLPELMGIVGLSARIDSVCPEGSPGCTPAPIVVERSMYWTGLYRSSVCGDLTPVPLQKLSGHNATGLQSAADTWYLAEGSTEIFETFVLIANVGDAPTTVEVDVLTRDRTRVPLQPFPLEAGKRRTLVFASGGTSLVQNPGGWSAPAFARTSFSVAVRGTPGSELVVERAMYDVCNTPRGQWRGGHASLGLTEPKLRWEFAEGSTLNNPGGVFDAFLLMGNPNAQDARVRLTFLLEGSAPLVCEADVPANTRISPWLNTEVVLDGGQCRVLPTGGVPPPGSTFALAGRSFGIVVESIAAPPAVPVALPILAERAMYWGPGTPAGRYTRWREGHNAPGLGARALTWAFAEGVDGKDDRAGRTAALPFTSYFLVSNPHPTPLDVVFTFYDEDGRGLQLPVTVPGERRFTLNPTDFRNARTPRLDTLLPFSNRRFSVFIESTNNQDFIAERAIYWGRGWDGGHVSPGTPWNGPVAAPTAPPLPPEITSISPAAGPLSGGQQVTITGRGFHAGAADYTPGGANTQISTTVTFGGVPLANVVFVDSTTITGTVPPAATGGAVDVVAEWRVTTNVADTPSTTTVTATKANGYLYENPPVIASLSPGGGPTYGDTVVTITGANFGSSAAGIVVRFRGVAAEVVSVEPDRIVVKSPPNAAGDAGVTVTRDGVTGPQYSGFAYTAALATDNILAFGDSITYGTTSEWVDLGGVWRLDKTLRADIPYPERLQSILSAVYTSQAASIFVARKGVPGECAAYECGPSGDRHDPGYVRFPGELAALPSTDLALVFEGINDLHFGLAPVRDALLQMVQTARAGGKLAVLATLLPVKLTEQEPGVPNPFAYPADPALISQMNDIIRTMAVPPGVVKVDLNAAFLARPEGWESLLSPDGLHPNEDGYRAIAQIFASAIRAHFEAVKRPVP